MQMDFVQAIPDIFVQCSHHGGYFVDVFAIFLKLTPLDVVNLFTK
jgi:hypothetical protein